MAYVWCGILWFPSIVFTISGGVNRHICRSPEPMLNSDSILNVQFGPWNAVTKSCPEFSIVVIRKVHYTHKHERNGTGISFFEVVDVVIIKKKSMVESGEWIGVLLVR
jgi:hypothetical protein